MTKRFNLLIIILCVAACLSIIGSVLITSNLRRKEVPFYAPLNLEEVGAVKTETVIYYLWEGDSSGFKTSSSEYDKLGNMVKRMLYHPSSHLVTDVYEYEYDENGNQTKLSHYDFDGNIKYWIETEYNEDGNKLTETRFLPNGTVEHLTRTEYDSEGKAVLSKRYNSNGAVRGITKYKYDGGGNLICRQSYNSTGMVPMSRNQYDYDVNGNVIKDSYYGGHGETTPDSWQEYGYDSDGNVISEKGFWHGSERQFLSGGIEHYSADMIYNKNGKVVRTVTTNHESDNGWFEHRYTYYSEAELQQGDSGGL